ncbi:MAG: alkaline phosphatase [Cellvibrionaceae bacterium]
MIKRLLKPTLSMALLAASVGLSNHSLAQAESESPEIGDRRNVILIIGDGMDDHQITIARNYLKGAQGKLLLDQMPVRSASQILTQDDETPSKPVYVADSANSATSMATGVSTSRGRIATSAGEDRDLTTIAEMAKQAGYATGIVTTASVTDATPASFIAHVASRGCENPGRMLPSDDSPRWLDPSACEGDRMINGGPGSISEQIASGNHDVILGGGKKHFKGTAESSDQTITELAQENGYRIITDETGLMELQNTALVQDKVLGLFSPSTMPTRWRGQDGRSAEKPVPSLLNMIDWRIGSVELPSPMTCETNPEFSSMPSLKLMTDTALEQLSRRSDQGMFLMIESASIDKQSHLRNPCGSIGEVEQLEEALASALAFAQDNPNTLILVTADHGQAAQLIPSPSMYKAVGVPVYTPGHMARLITPENQIMAVNYATNDFPSEEHTGTNVPLFGNQVGAGRIAPMVTQPEIFIIMKNYLLP